MHPSGVEYFYSKFDSMIHMPEYLALAGTTFIVIMLVKAGILTLTGYKKFGTAILIAAIANLLSVGGLYSFFHFKIVVSNSLLGFCGIMIGALLVIDLIVALAFKGKSDLVDGLIGTTLGNLIVASVGLVIIILQLFPLT